jgi:flagellum-specific peptidoglycan hydrolase FlgJ
MITTNDCFRVYDNPEEAFRDHSEFLKKKNYARLFELDKNDFNGWAYGLKACRLCYQPQIPAIAAQHHHKYQP